MKILLLTFLLLYPVLSSAQGLKGTWVRCDLTGKKLDLEHYLEFRDNNVEYEVFVASRPHRVPCLGPEMFSYVSMWHFEDKGKEFRSTRFQSKAMAMDVRTAQAFIKKKVCGKTIWVPEVSVECSGETFLGINLQVGEKTKHKYQLVGDELHVTDDDGERYIFKKYVSGK